MKKIFRTALLISLLTLIVASLSTAQLTTQIGTNVYANDSSYTRTGISLGQYSRVSAVFRHTDTVNVKVIAQYKQSTASSWTSADTTTVNVNTTTTVQTEIVYRNNTTEKIPGLNVQTRWLVEFQSSGNGVAGTRTYWLTLHYAQ